MDFGVLEGNFGPAVPRAAQGDLESPPRSIHPLWNILRKLHPGLSG